LHRTHGRAGPCSHPARPSPPDPNVWSVTPNSFATCEIGRPDVATSCTASPRNCGENVRFTFRSLIINFLDR
jgi:hypothetical protein